MEYRKELIQVGRQELLADLAGVMGTKRYQHCLRVEATALELAKTYPVEDLEALSAISLLHDYAKELPAADQKRYALAYAAWEPGSWSDQDLVDLRQANSNIWHGYAAAYIAKTKYGMDDPDLLQAMAEHTVGGMEGMTSYSQLLFIADYIEPARDFPAVRQARQLAHDRRPMAELMAHICQSTIEHLAHEGQEIYPASIRVYNYWLKEVRK